MLYNLLLMISCVGSFTFPCSRLGASLNSDHKPTAFQLFAKVSKNNDDDEIRPRKRLLVFGLGNMGSLIAQQCSENGTYFNDVYGTSRSSSTKTISSGVQVINFNSYRMLQEIIPSCTHILITIPPVDVLTDNIDINSNKTLDGGGGQCCDPVLYHPMICLRDLVQPNTWIGYISTTAVYGNHDGEWVTEESEVKCEPGSNGELYYRAEEEWRNVAHDCNLRLHIFRASGLYGNTRSAIHTIRKGQYSTSVPNSRAKSPTSRIHEEDASRAITSAMMDNEPVPGASCLWNLADDEPADRDEVMALSKKLLENANIVLPRMSDEYSTSALNAVTPQRSGRVSRRLTDRKRVRNQKMKNLLLPDGKLLYPTYREGLQSILDFNRADWC
jgi:hypothetical protein